MPLIWNKNEDTKVILTTDICPKEDLQFAMPYWISLLNSFKFFKIFPACRWCKLTESSQILNKLEYMRQTCIKIAQN